MFYITFTMTKNPTPQILSFEYQEDSKKFLEAIEQSNDVETVIFTDSKGKLIETYTNLHLEE